MATYNFKGYSIEIEGLKRDKNVFGKFYVYGTVDGTECRYYIPDGYTTTTDSYNEEYEYGDDNEREHFAKAVHHLCNFMLEDYYEQQSIAEQEAYYNR